MKTEETIVKNIEITSRQLTQWFRKEENVYILDIRPTEQREEWSIPESRHADIYGKIKEGYPDPFKGVNIPDDRPVVTVCAAGKTSLAAALLLRENGYEAYSLQGGMKAWNFAWDTQEVSFGDVEVVQVRRAAKGCLSYVIGSGNEAVVIDASLDPEVYTGLAKERGWTITRVMDTHIHADYVSRTRNLADTTGVPLLIYRHAGASYPFTPFDDGQEIPFGTTSLKVLHTPGHTPESLSFLIEGKAVFTGDTLFTDGLGRPDLKADRDQVLEKASHLYESLRKLMSLKAENRVLPAHTSGSLKIGDPVVVSTIGALKEGLELPALPKDEFIHEIISRIPPTPPNYHTISEINRSGNESSYRREDLEAGANRCAVS